MDDLYYPEFEEPALTDVPTVYVKLDIAREYLDLAMRCYVEQRDYFCAIHLAGAAEELLGQWLAPEDRISTAALKAHKQMTLLETGKTPSDGEARRYLNWSKNTIKHMDDGNPHIILDPVYEAGWWIEKALVNYYKIGFPKSPTLWDYEDFLNRVRMRGEEPLAEGIPR